MCFINLLQKHSVHRGSCCHIAFEANKRPWRQSEAKSIDLKKSVRLDTALLGDQNCRTASKEGTAPMPGKKVCFGEFELDFGRFQLCRRGQPVRLEGLPLDLLMFLVENHGQLVTREQIAEKLWGKDVFVDVEQGINTAIRKIRLALDDDSSQPQCLQTVVGKGYRFVGGVGSEAGATTSDAAVVFSAEELGRAIKAAAGLHEEDP